MLQRPTFLELSVEIYHLGRNLTINRQRGKRGTGALPKANRLEPKTPELQGTGLSCIVASLTTANWGLELVDRFKLLVGECACP